MSKHGINRISNSESSESLSKSGPHAEEVSVENALDASDLVKHKEKQARARNQQGAGETPYFNAHATCLAASVAKFPMQSQCFLCSLRYAAADCPAALPPPPPAHPSSKNYS